MEPQKIKKPSHFQRLQVWVKAHKKWAIVLSILLVLVIAGGVTAALSLILNTEPEAVQQVVVEPEPEPEPPKYYSPLTGELVASEAITKQPVTGVMVENSPNARPQSGIKDAGIVFETVTEGGITRFLLLYQEDKPTLIGPVRSVRMAFVDWVAAFNASVAHVGGSYAALQQLRNGSYRDIDQFFNAGTYWRATDRYAPHNVYTNFERLDALNKAKGYTESTFTAFPRADLEEADELDATRITVTMSGALYDSTYRYNAETGLYARSQGGEAHNDREKGRISPKVVIIMEAPLRPDQITTIGKGNAYIFQNGSVTEGTWQKKSRTAQLTFTDAAGDPIELARGQTWISAVPTSTGGVTWR